MIKIFWDIYTIFIFWDIYTIDIFFIKKISLKTFIKPCGIKTNFIPNKDLIHTENADQKTKLKRFFIKNILI